MLKKCALKASKLCSYEVKLTLNSYNITSTEVSLVLIVKVITVTILGLHQLKYR